MCAENNFYGISGSQRELMNITDISDRAKGYGIPGVTADGNDIEKVCKISWEAVERARNGGGPSLLEFKTWRHRGHWEGDPDLQKFTYRSRTEHEAWLKKDPIPAARQKLLQEYGATEQEVKQIEDDVDCEVKEAVAFAEQSPLPDAEDLLKDIYA